MNFISDACKALHEDYLRTMKLRLSIFEKSYSKVAGKSLSEIERMRIPSGEREELIRLKAEILAHELYFSSFGASNERCERVCEHYGSEAAFLYRLFTECACVDGGFLLLYADSRGKPSFYAGRDYIGLLYRDTPMLAVDLCEHAYFCDYGFNRDSYVKAALSELKLSKIFK